MKFKLMIMVTMLLLLVPIVIMGGCKKKEPAAPAVSQQISQAIQQEMANTICPVMGEPVDKNIFVEYNGRKIYFCCKDCVKKFEENPEKYLANLK